MSPARGARRCARPRSATTRPTGSTSSIPTPSRPTATASISSGPAAPSVTGVIARGAQNGIGLFESRDAIIADNDVSGNSRLGHPSLALIPEHHLRNKADHNVRCESPAYRHGCDSAALLLRERSDSNLIADNDLTWSGDGFFLSGQRPEVSGRRSAIW